MQKIITIRHQVADAGRSQLPLREKIIFLLKKSKPKPIIDTSIGFSQKIVVKRKLGCTRAGLDDPNLVNHTNDQNVKDASLLRRQVEQQPWRRSVLYFLSFLMAAWFIVDRFQTKQRMEMEWQ
jgi:hypothetical protein